MELPPFVTWRWTCTAAYSGSAVMCFT